MVAPLISAGFGKAARILPFAQRIIHSRLSSTSTSTGPRSRSFVGLASATFAIGAASYVAGSAYPPHMATFMFPRPSPAPPSADSAEGIAKTEAIEYQLQGLPDVQRLREQTDRYYEMRPYANYPEAQRVHSLTSGSLRGPTKLAVPPLLFATHDDLETVIFMHLGRSLCGHDGIVHGGLLATLMDESLARTGMVNLPNKIAVTANLTVNYRAPTKADQFVKITTKLVETKGRKAVVTGRVEDLNGTLLVDATATMVEPRYANMLRSSAVTAALGETEKGPRKDMKGPVPQEPSV